MSRTSGRPVSAGTGSASAPSPGGTAGKQPSAVRARTINTADTRLCDYEARRYRVLVENPTGSGGNIVLGHLVAKNRNVASTYPITLAPGDPPYISPPFYPYPLHAKASAGTVAINIRQELVADR